MSSDLTPIGILCGDILEMINTIPGVPLEATDTLAARIDGILRIFGESKKRELAARKAVSSLKSDLRRKEELLTVLRQELFGKSSERGTDDDDHDDFDDLLDEIEEPSVVKVKGKRGRKVPADIATVVNHHYPDDRTCCSCGCEMAAISNWTSNRIQIVPEHVIRVQDVHHTCACNRELCKDNAPKAAKAKRFIMKGRSCELEFMAEAAYQKFGEHIPTFRMERRLKNNNVNVSRQAISAGIAHLATHLRPIQEEIFTYTTSGHAAHMDETPMRVQAPGTGKCDTGYLWAICRDERRWNLDAKPAAFYKYAPTRSGEVAIDLLAGSALRVLHIDGYGAYGKLAKDDRIGGALILSRCWAHVRRKFVETQTATESRLAANIVKLIRQMYAIEKAANGYTAEDRLTLRRRKTQPILAAIHGLLVKNEAVTQGLLRSAIKYALNAFEALCCFAEDGRLEIDNNPVERCIRGIAITKKNSLFAGTHDAADVWATYYTLIETCKLNDIDPRRYLVWASKEIERNNGNVDFAMLLPWHCPVGRIEV